MAAYKKDSHCSYCGHPFDPDQSWPRRCRHCHNVSFRNPLPVAVILVPVGGGLLLVRRSIEPQKGRLALPGGYIEVGESWQEAGARELWEETGLRLAPAQIREFRVRSAPDGTLLVFGLAPALTRAALPPFTPRPEVSERLVASRPLELAFPLHTEAMAAFFAARFAS